MEKSNNYGSISKNKYKKMDSHPDITGKAMIDGVEKRIAGWHKVSENGPYYSLQFSNIEKKPNKASSGGNIDDASPF